MFEIKKGKTQFVPVRLFNVNGDGFLRGNYTDVTASLLLSDNTQVTLGVSASAWFEASSSAFYGLGTYQLQIPSASVTTTGSLTYAVYMGPNLPATTFLGVLKIVEVIEADTFNRIGVPTSASISADIASLSASLVNVSSSIGGGIDRIRLTEEGRWKIDTNLNTMTFYKQDGSVWRVYGLSGSDGIPNFSNPYERNPVG